MRLYWATIVFFSAPIPALTCVSLAFLDLQTHSSRTALCGPWPTPQDIQRSVGFSVKGEIIPEITDCHCSFGLNTHGFCFGLDLGYLPVAFTFCALPVRSQAVLPLTTLRCAPHAPDRSPGVSSIGLLCSTCASDFHALIVPVVASFSEALFDQKVVSFPVRLSSSWHRSLAGRTGYRRRCHRCLKCPHGRKVRPQHHQLLRHCPSLSVTRLRHAWKLHRPLPRHSCLHAPFKPLIVH